MNRKGKPYFTPSDTPEMIEYCLNCRWTECWNCLGRSNAYSIGLRLELGGKIKTGVTANKRV